MQELWREVGAIRPNKRVKFLMHFKRLKVFPVLQGLKDWTIEPVGQIDLPRCAVVKT